MRLYFVFALNILNNASNLANRVLLPLFAVKLGASPLMVGILGAMFATFPAFLAVTAGRLNDRFGSKHLMILGTLGTAIGMVLPAYWPSMTSIMVAALLAGFAQVFFNLSTQNLTGLLSTPETRAKNFSNYALSNSTGQFLGPVIGGYTLEHFPDSEAFLVMALFALLPLALLMARRKPLEPSHAPSRSKKERPKASMGGTLEMLRDPVIRRSLYSGAIQNSGSNLFLFYMPVYAHSLGISASTIGLIMAAQASAAFVVRAAMPRLIRELKEDKVLALAFCIGSTALVFVPVFQNPVMLGALAFLFGSGMGIAGPVVTMQMFSNAPAGRSGESIGLKMSSNQGVKVISPMLFGAVASVFGLSPMFWLNALLVGTGGYLSWPKKKKKAADAAS